MRRCTSIIIIFILTCVQVMCVPLDSQTTSNISYTNIASILKITIETQEKIIEIWWNFVSQQFNSQQDSSLVSRHLIHGGPNIHAILQATYTWKRDNAVAATTKKKVLFSLNEARAAHEKSVKEWWDSIYQQYGQSGNALAARDGTPKTSP
ncbi:hypothetical protein MFLAVUS_003853 [Mucor flavus]|uniref:Uncharacterized protein n=1 Tax=Mucor flavus TaxID=439312 RepID=A0ABP9YU93_9FUNG